MNEKANSVNHYQTAPEGLNYSIKHICPNLYGITVINVTFFIGPDKDSLCT